MNRSKLVLVSILASFASIANAAVTFTGIAFNNVPGIAVGDVGALIIDRNGSGFAGLSFEAGLPLNLDSTYGDFTVALGVTRTATSPVTGLITLTGAFSGINLVNGVSTGDRFAYVIFSSSTASTIAGDTFTVWTDPTWIIPADGQSIAYNANPTGTQFRQFTSTATPTFIGSVAGGVIPEPSSFAALAGLLAVGFAASRRRRVA